MLLVVLVESAEHFTERPGAEDVGVRINLIVLLELLGTLLLS